jgi:excisionase family DNA binding protein
MTKTLSLLTQAQAAKSLGTTPRTVRRLIADGTLPAYRVGPRMVRIREDDVFALLRRIPTAHAS